MGVADSMTVEICQECGKFTSYRTGGRDTDMSGFLCRDCWIECPKCGKAFPDWMIAERCTSCGTLLD